MNQRKLLLHERVEVRQFEEGLRGSWHPGVVVGVSDLCRRVEYDELLCEYGELKLVESIPVTEAIEGRHLRRHVSSTYRGRIRPPPPVLKVDSSKKVGFGVCVDVLFEDAWWEGIVFDCNADAEERYVFFPDENDYRKFSVSCLRVAQEWDEFMGVWRHRGVWMLVQLARDLCGHFPLSSFIKKVWSTLRLNYGFTKMISEWPCGGRSVWRKYFMDVVYEIAAKSSRRDLGYYKILSYIIKMKGNKLKGSEHAKSNSNLFDPLVQVRNQKIVAKVGKKAIKSKDSQHVMLNSCTCASLIKVRNQIEFRVTRSRQKQGENAPYGECNKQQSPNARNGDPLVQVRNHKIVANKVGKKAIKSNGSQLVKLNSHICDSLIKVRNQIEFRVTRSRQKQGENARNGECNKQQSPNSSSGYEEPSVVKTADRNGLMANNLCREMQMTSASFIEINTVRKGESHQIPNSSSGFNKVLNCVSYSTQKKPDRAESEVEKLNPLTGCEGEENKILVDILKEEKIGALGVHNFQINQSVKRRRNLTKRNVNNKIALVFNNFWEKQRERKASLFIVQERRKSSLLKEKDSKKCRQVNLKLKPSPKVEEQRLYAVQKEEDLFSNHCRPSRQFEKYGKNLRPKDLVSHSRKRKRKQGCHDFQLKDTICSVCHHGGDLIHCSHCPSSYHLSCLNLEDIAGGKWFCPSCCCALCGFRDFNDENHQFTNICLQCTRGYHMTCLRKAGSFFPAEHASENFCSEACFKLCVQLHQLLGISNTTAVDGLTWTLIRSNKNAYSLPYISRTDSCIKLSSVLRVIHDCFEPVKEPHTQRDLVRDVIYNSRGDEIVSVATVRFFGLKVAEMPLVATPFQYRRQGMCRLLVHELEKLLTRFGVERLVLPSIIQLQNTWEASFGFSELLHYQRVELFPYPFLVFQGTKMLQKFISNSTITKEINGIVGRSGDSTGNTSPLSLEHNGEVDNRGRFSGLFYKRKSKRKQTKIIGKENLVNSNNGNTQRFGYVYKRRRVLGNRD